MLYRLKNRGICWFFWRICKIYFDNHKPKLTERPRCQTKKRFFLWCVKTYLKTKRTKLKQQDLSRLVNPTDAQKEWQSSLPRSSSLGGVFEILKFLIVSRTSNLQSPPLPPPPPLKRSNNQSINENVCPKKKKKVALSHPYEGSQVSINANWNFVLRRKQ